MQRSALSIILLGAAAASAAGAQLQQAPIANVRAISDSGYKIGAARWETFEHPEFRVDFPADRPGLKIQEGPELSVFETFSLKANFGVIVQTLGTPSAPRYIENTYDTLSAAMLSSKNSKLIGMRSVKLGSLTGRELTLEKDGLRIYGRIFVSGKRVFIVSVNIPSADYTPAFEREASRFFASFSIITGKGLLA